MKNFVARRRVNVENFCVSVSVTKSKLSQASDLHKHSYSYDALFDTLLRARGRIQMQAEKSIGDVMKGLR